jgi:hypothetical protein
MQAQRRNLWQHKESEQIQKKADKQGSGGF